MKRSQTPFPVRYVGPNPTFMNQTALGRWTHKGKQAVFAVQVDDTNHALAFGWTETPREHWRHKR